MDPDPARSWQAPAPAAAGAGVSKGPAVGGEGPFAWRNESSVQHESDVGDKEVVGMELVGFRWFTTRALDRSKFSHCAPCLLTFKASGFGNALRYRFFGRQLQHLLDFT